MLNCLAAGEGGAPGAILRCLIGLLPVKMQSGFPIKTFLINIEGSFLIGIAAALAARRELGPRAVLFLRVGICGGFTTFSSFALETQDLLTAGKSTAAFLYCILSVIPGVPAVCAAERLAG